MNRRRLPWPLVLIATPFRVLARIRLPRHPQRAAGVPETRTPPAALARSRRLALVVIAALVAAASLVSFAESYRGLYDWSVRHGLHGLWAMIWPIQVDVFIAVGELALFVGLAYAWDARSRAGAWLVTLAGLAVSVAGNVGHITSHMPADRATAAIPPIAAASALAVGLGVLKRVVEARSPGGDERGRDSGTAEGARPGAVPAAPPVTAAVTPGVTVPTVQKIRQRRKCSPATAQKIQAELRLFMKTLSNPPAGILPPAGAQDSPAGNTGTAGDSGRDAGSPLSVLAAPFNGRPS